LGFFRGSIGIDVVILVAAGVVVQYGALRSGLDYLRNDFAHIIGRELRRDGFSYRYIESLVLLGDRFNPPVAAPTPANDTTVPVAAWLRGGVAFLTAVLTAIAADAANVDRVRVNFPDGSRRQSLA
jgi:hypothetical protein